MFIPQLESLVAGQVSSMAVATGAASAQAKAQGILTGFIDLSTKTFLVIPVVAILIFLAIGLKALLDLGKPGAFFAGVLGIALGLAMIGGVAGLGYAHVEDTADISFADDIQGPNAPGELSAEGSHWGGSGGHGILKTWWDFGVSITQPVKKRDYKYDVRKHEPTETKKTVIYRRTEKFDFRANYSDGQFDGTIDASALIDLTPPTTRIAPEYEEGPWKLLRVKKFDYTTAHGRLDLSLTREGSDLRMSAVVKNDDSTSDEKAVLLFRKEVVQPMKSEVKETHGGGTEEGKTSGVPNWMLIAGFCAVIPAGLVYVGEEERWW